MGDLALRLAESGDAAKCTTVLVDAHVHLHGRPSVALLHAARNLGTAREVLGLPATNPAALMLTETAGANRFNDLQRADAELPPGWTITRTREPGSLRLDSAGGAPLFLIAGRQIATRDGLEVLALACPSELPDGESTQVTVERVLAVGGIPVVPWGLGKWWGRRGRIVAGLLQRFGPALSLGDTHARWGQVAEPRLFAVARRHGVPLLPGSDAFPVGRGERHVASYGLALEAKLDESEPAASLRAALSVRPLTLRPFGRRAALASTCRNQVLMQVRKRVRRRVA